METKKQKEKKINTLPDTDKESLRIIGDRLKKLLKGEHITEESVQELTTMSSELTAMKDKHQEYLLRWAKQNYILG